MAEHAAGPGHTRCSWADEACFVEGPEWPRNPDGTLRWLRGFDYRTGHHGPLVVFNWIGASKLQDDCRVCGWVVSVDVTGRAVRDSLAPAICSTDCLRRFMGHLMDTSGPTTEEIVTRVEPF